MKKLIFLLFFLIQSNAYAGWLWGPDNYEECLAENIKTTPSERAAGAINMACRGLFPEKKYENSEECINQINLPNPESVCRYYFPTDEKKKFCKCVLENLKGVRTDRAAGVIVSNCAKKYPY